MKLENPKDSRVQVVIKTSKKRKDGKKDFQTHKTFNIFETTPKEVVKVIQKALESNAA